MLNTYSNFGYTTLIEWYDVEGKRGLMEYCVKFYCLQGEYYNISDIQYG